MLTPEILKIAIVMIARAPLKGEEAAGVAVTQQALQAEYTRLAQEAEAQAAAEEQIEKAPKRTRKSK